MFRQEQGVGIAESTVEYAVNFDGVRGAKIAMNLESEYTRLRVFLKCCTMVTMLRNQPFDR